MSREVKTGVGELGMVVVVRIGRGQSHETVIVVVFLVVLDHEVLARAMPCTKAVDRASAEVINDEPARAFSERHHRVGRGNDDKEDIVY